MKNPTFYFLDPGATSTRLLAAIENVFPEAHTLSNDFPSSGNGSPRFGQHDVEPSTAMEKATHVFIEANCSRSLTLIDEVRPYLQDGVVITDLLPIKKPFSDYLLRDALEREYNQDCRYLGMHWLWPSPADSVMMALVTTDGLNEEQIQDSYPVLYALAENLADMLVPLSVAEHDQLVARRIQLPGLLYKQNGAGSSPVWGCAPPNASHPALQYDALIANQNQLLDVLSEHASKVKTVQNHLITEDEEFFRPES